jgi:transposase
LNQVSEAPFDCQIPWGLGLRPKLGQSAVTSHHQLEATMLSSADNTETETPIRTDLRAIFVSLELSRTTWLVTSLSPGTREKMSKYSVPAGDIGNLLDRLRSLQERVQAQRKQLPPLVVIQEAGLEGFWIHRVLTENGIESHVVDPASIATSRRRRRAKTDKTRWRHTGSHLARLQTR